MPRAKVLQRRSLPCQPRVAHDFMEVAISSLQTNFSMRGTRRTLDAAEQLGSFAHAQPRSSACVSARGVERSALANLA